MVTYHSNTLAIILPGDIVGPTGLARDDATCLNPDASGWDTASHLNRL